LPLFGRKKKEKKEEEVKIEKEESEVTEEEEEVIEEEKEDLIEMISERVGGLENRITKLDISISSVRREMDELRKEMERIDSSLQDVLTLYELVSSQINPFVDALKSIDYNSIISRFEENEERLKQIDKELTSIKRDLELVVLKDYDLDRWIEDFLREKRSIHLMGFQNFEAQEGEEG